MPGVARSVNVPGKDMATGTCLCNVGPARFEIPFKKFRIVEQAMSKRLILALAFVLTLIYFHFLHLIHFHLVPSFSFLHL